ncbi:MAG: desampylase [Halobacteriales archaeon]
MSADPEAIIDPDSYDALLTHATEGAPQEVCGVLGGVRDGDTYWIDCVIRTTNAAATPRDRYLLDPADQLAAMERIEDSGRCVVGFYHSHPTGSATPSPVDRRDATWPDALYVIVAPNADPSVRAWRWEHDSDSFRSVTVHTASIDGDANSGMGPST